jgi:AraC-like DNA-binding protein
LKTSLIKPSDQLKDIIKHYIVIESFDLHEKFWILPNAGNFILFNPGLEAFLHKYDSNEEPFALPKDFSVSIKANNIVRLSVNEGENIEYPLLGVELLPTGCNRLFSDKETDMRSVYQLLEVCLKEKEVSFDKLYDFKKVQEQIDYIEEGFLELKERASPVHDSCVQIEKVIEYISNTLYRVNVSDILLEFDSSRTTLERDFKRIVGYTPKEFIQIMRFSGVFKDLIKNGYDFIRLEYEFFDQSHMNKAFKRFIDISPSKLKAYIEEQNIHIYQLNRDYE